MTILSGIIEFDAKLWGFRRCIEEGDKIRLRTLFSGSPSSGSEAPNPVFGVHGVDAESAGSGDLDWLLFRDLSDNRSDFSFTFSFVFLTDATTRSRISILEVMCDCCRVVLGWGRLRWKRLAMARHAG